VVKEFDLDLDELHNDSTTVTFFGEYRGAGEGKLVRGKKTPAVTFGHNKDHRPDLKQLLYHLTVSADGTVPVAFGVESGNVTDDQTHRETWDLLCKIAGRSDFLYVADSKLATRENMSYIVNRGSRFISVLPRSRKEDQEFRERVIRDEISWKEVHRKVSDQGYVKDIISAASEGSITAEGYRLVWFHSTRKAELDLARRSTAVRKAMKALDVLALKLLSSRTRYRDEAKVIGEVERILTKYGVKACFEYEVKPQNQETFVQNGKGRPGPDTVFRLKVKKGFRLHFVAGEERLAQEARHDGVFPLVTNDRKLSDTEVLHAYKRQAYIEKRFSQLKTQFQLTPVFLKSTHRLVALLTVYYFALLIQALIERELRGAMKKAGIDAIPAYPEERECKAPSTRRTLDLFDNVERHELVTATSKEPTIFATELSESQRLVLELLEIPEGDYDA
jgi:transposase